MDNISFGKFVRQERIRDKLTQRQLAEKVQALGLSCDFTYISRIETEKTNMPPSEKLIIVIADVLDVDKNALLDLSGRFNAKKLQVIALEYPEVGALLRRIQNCQVPIGAIRHAILESDKLIKGQGEV